MNNNRILNNSTNDNHNDNKKGRYNSYGMIFCPDFWEFRCFVTVIFYV